MSAWTPEPCGRCGHDVNEHASDARGGDHGLEEVAGECQAVVERDLTCECDGFITKTEATEAKHEPFKEVVVPVPLWEVPRQEAMIAMLRASGKVRDGFWIKGAPTHVLAEYLAVLEAEGWRLVRAAT